MNLILLPAAVALLAIRVLYAAEAPLLTLDATEATLAAARQPASPHAGDPPTSTDTRALFGEGPHSSGHTWFITVGAGWAQDADPGTHVAGYVALSTFVARELEFQIELSGWYFSQPGDNTGGVGLAINVRWHFLHGTYGEGFFGGSGFDYTLFGEAGIGCIVSGDDVPPGGTDFNLTPRFGVGATFGLGDLGGGDARLILGLRWHHMSNARILGDDDNPDFNAPMLYLGVQWPF